ncbi:nuclease-related domain-containing protein [Demequina capsici]|uniref:Nuclease-related domain-containing protein n=1 Tax=Demequina capsici TaxID=3075620 RepID=A0AA96J8N5_9MICO|nr:nuclease-related domain-containing protein [Demequina sp. PMTSA13]WNM26397.1 nuclease-related domain-containing protein [Demequina sp. PMTSA13]
MDLPTVRRWRKGAMDRLYVTDQAGVDLGWADTATGEITVVVPGSEGRLDAAFVAWAALQPDDDLALHAPGRNVDALTAAYTAEIASLSDSIVQLEAQLAAARFSRDQYAKGTAGEYRVGEAVNRLYQHGWGIIHAVPINGGAADIDHLLIGPGGVWTVNSKRHDSSEVFINGDYMRVGRVRVDHIAQARREAAAASLALSLPDAPVAVSGCVVLDTSYRYDMTVIEEPEGVVVHHLASVPSVFHNLPRVLDGAEILRIYSRARRPETWDPET